MEGKVIKEESDPLACSPRPASTTPTPVTPSSGGSHLLPSGKENRVSNGRSAASSPAAVSLNLSTNSNTSPGPGGATEILTRSRTKVLSRDIDSPTHKPPRSHSSTRSPSPTPVTSVNLSISRSSHTPTTAYAHSHQSHSSHYNGGSNRRTPSPPGMVASRTPVSSATNSSSSSGSSSSSNSHNSRLLVKIKRFLGTLLHFGAEVSPEVGERVRTLVHSLVSGHLGVEEFGLNLQETTAYPLRPFVLPFLRSHLPLLQKDVSNAARQAKQGPLAYVQTHESAIIDTGGLGEHCDIFHSEASDLSLKRKATDGAYENGDSMESSGYSSTPKRHHSMFSPPFFASDYYATAGYNLSIPQGPSSSNHNHESLNPSSTTPSNGLTHSQAQSQMKMMNGGNGDEEWKNIHTMLQCVLSMVEKTKRALTILQSRSQSEAQQDPSLGSWLRRPSSLLMENSEELKRHMSELMAQAFRATEERVTEVKRRAEEAVQEVKRQALLELKRAVAAAEGRATDAVASERARLERALRAGDTSSSAGSSSTVVHPPIATNLETEHSCWNCGRKAHETCSGCNTARYCSSFCQHKDWESHHTVCGRERDKASGGTSASSPLSVGGTVGGGNSNPSPEHGSPRSSN